MNSYKILYEDNDCAVIDKPAGVLVHPVPGGDDADTIAKWWARCEGVSKNGWTDSTRVGIVHRLDKDTSGALLLAKTPNALAYYQQQFKKRKIAKKYTAVVFGSPKPADGKVVSNISRDNKDKTHRQSHLISFGNVSTKKAVSIYRTIKTNEVRGAIISVIEFSIKTGRTHQIRIHAKMLGCPILGDDFYFTKPSRRLSLKLDIHRQMLHARTLGFTNTVNKFVDVSSPLPKDMEQYV